MSHLRSLHWLPVKQRIKFKWCLLMFTILKFELPKRLLTILVVWRLGYSPQDLEVVGSRPSPDISSDFNKTVNHLAAPMESEEGLESPILV